MLRFVALAVMLVGCDLAWQLERDLPPPVCGPFSAPEPVPFHAELVEPRDFSVDSSGTRGLIYAQYPRTTRPTGVHAIKLVDDEWRADPARDNGAITSLDGAHIAEDNFAIGWLIEEGVDRPEIREYEFFPGPGAWNQGTSGLVDPLQGQTSTGGNLIVLPYAGVATIRFMVTILMSERVGDPNTMRIFQLFPNETQWELTAQADPLKTSKAKISPSGGVMTADHNKLVYAAKIGNDTLAPSRLYGSVRIANEYEEGDPLIIEGVDGDDDLTEPWINADCSKLYFRKDAATWMADAVDDAGAAP